MNIQDVADFLDLVKNPTKYEKVLQNLKEEQARLTAVIETVGKVSEINTLLKQAQDKEAKLEADYVNKRNAVEKQAEEDTVVIGQLKAKAKVEVEQSSKLAEDLADQAKEMSKLRSELSKREKALVTKEAILAATQESLDVMVKEYEEKLAKLRAVMV